MAFMENPEITHFARKPLFLVVKTAINPYSPQGLKYILYFPLKAPARDRGFGH